MLQTESTLLNGKKKIHFIGIGGSGTFPLAQILQSQGFEISGSDNNETDTLEAERQLGMRVILGQRPENIEGAEVIVYTAAVMEDNPELIAARQSGLPVLERAELLGLLTQRYENCICVSGTHGKTTTTALLTHILYLAGVDPTAVIGGKLSTIGGSGRAGKSPVMTCEACEFEDHFLRLSPDISVILNIDADHLDYFGSLENIIKSFHRFASQTSRALLVNGDDRNSLQAVQGIEKDIVTFGFGDKNDYYAQNITQEGGVRSSFDLMHRGDSLGRVQLNIPGRHNVLNTLAAIAAARQVGVPVEEILRHIASFHGAGRRFEVLGEVGGITIADDYAHHPAEIEVTLQAAKQMDFREIWAVHQPFTYSRTKMLLDDFARVLSIADHVVLSEIMGAREKNTYNIYTKDLADKIEGSVWFPTFEGMADYVMSHAQPGDLVITLGCGDVNKCAKMMLQRRPQALKEKEPV